MWLMASWLMAFVAGSTLADYCGDHKVPFGMEVHKNGNVNILCSRPSCHEKKYAVSCFSGYTAFYDKLQSDIIEISTFYSENSYV